MAREFCDCYEEYLALHRGSWRPITHDDQERFYLNIVGPALRRRAIDSIRPKDIVQILDRRPIQVRTRRQYLRLLRQFWNWAIRAGYCTANPASGVPCRPGVARRLVPFSASEARQLMAACGDAERPVLAIFLLTGLRRHNVCNLRPEHVQDDLLVIPGEEMKNGHDLVVPYHPQLATVLRRLPLGISRGGVARLFTRLRQRTDIQRARPHLCRHTFGTWIAQHAPEAVVAQLLGHHRQRDSITALYIHVDVERMRAALDQLPRLL